MKYAELAKFVNDTVSSGEKFHLETFDKISEEKRNKILEAAIIEFSGKGFNAANINTIAKNAGISIGSMYNYFASKDDLYLTLINYGYQLLESVISQIDLTQGDIFDKLEKLVVAAQEYSQKYPEITQLYLDMSTEALSHLSDKLSRKMETITAKYYKALISEAKEQGIVSRDIDENTASFCIDNILMMIQFSYTSRYYNERMKIFTNGKTSSDDRAVVHGVMQFIRRALSS